VTRAVDGAHAAALDAGAAQAAAEAARDAAAASATAADASASQAQAWAEAPADSEVAPGEFSAHHWAVKAAEIAQQGIPSGVLLAWHGGPASVPPGWRLADGTNGTPDLSGRFAAEATLVDLGVATGQAETATLAFEVAPDVAAGEVLVVNGAEHTAVAIDGAEVTVDPALPAAQGPVAAVGDVLDIAGTPHTVRAVPDAATLSVDIAPAWTAGDSLVLNGDWFTIAAVLDRDTVTLDPAPPCLPETLLHLPAVTVRTQACPPRLRVATEIRPPAVAARVRVPPPALDVGAAVHLPAVQVAARLPRPSVEIETVIHLPAVAVAVQAPAPRLDLRVLTWQGRTYTALGSDGTALTIDIAPRARPGDVFDFSRTYTVTAVAGQDIAIDPAMPFHVDHTILKRAIETARVWIMKA